MEVAEGVSKGTSEATFTVQCFLGRKRKALVPFFLSVGTRTPESGG